jgi:hypothetical protein
MKKAFLFFPILFFVSVSRAQLGLGLGIKAGANFANVSNASSINNSNASGFLFGAWLGGRKKLLRYRMELIFSRQGYDYKTSTNNGTVNLDYLLVPQLLTLNFGKFSIHGGGQVAFLLNAHVDSASGDNNPYGIAVGAEVFPYRSLILGVRYNRSLNDLYKSVTYSGGQINFAAPDLKNNVVQLYAGLRFGK